MPQLEVPEFEILQIELGYSLMAAYKFRIALLRRKSKSLLLMLLRCDPRSCNHCIDALLSRHELSHDGTSPQSNFSKGLIFSALSRTKLNKPDTPGTLPCRSNDFILESCKGAA